MSAENATGAIQTLIDSPKTGFVVAATTGAAGIVNSIPAWQSWLSMTASGIGIILASVLIVKHVLEVIQAWKELKKS